MNSLTISIILITYNKADRLYLTLQSLIRCKGIEKIELIIVNDGSTDHTKEILSQFTNKYPDWNIKILHAEHSGRSIARNIGFIASTNELLIHIDDDVILSEEFIEQHKRVHEQNKQIKLIVHGKIYNLPQLKFMKNPMNGLLYDGSFAKRNLLKGILTTQLLVHPEAMTKYLSKYARVTKFEKDIKNLFDHSSPQDSHFRWIALTGGNFSIRRDVIFESGNFDPLMGKEWGCEDLELGYRLYKTGCQFYYSNEAANYHISHYRASSSDIHEIAMQYFIKRHNDHYISLLNNYFKGEIPSLIDWKNKAQHDEV